MDEVKLASTSSDEGGVQKVRAQMDVLPVLRNQILQLLITRLSDDSIMVLQEELRLMQRSSYYLEIQCIDMPPTADEQQHRSHLSEGRVWSFIGQRQAHHTMAAAKTQVRLLLKLLEMLYQEIIASCRELEAFIIKYDQGLVDGDVAASTRRKLQQTHRYLNDFKDRMTRNLGPLDLQKQLNLKTGHYPMPRLSATLAAKMPVTFNRFESHATPNAVHLCWEVAGEGGKEPNQQFEIHGIRLNQTIDEDDDADISKSTRKYNMQVSSLMPDSQYLFSVKRVGAVNLVYRPWIDTIILKTLTSSKEEKKSPFFKR